MLDVDDHDVVPADAAQTRRRWPGRRPSAQWKVPCGFVQDVVRRQETEGAVVSSAASEPNALAR